MNAHHAALVLAAGMSRRLGAPKQLVRFEGATLVERAVDAALASGAAHVHVVLGAHADAIDEALGDRPVIRVRNAAFATGLGSSLRAGLASARTTDEALAAVLVMLCDQPHVEAAHLAHLLDAVGRGGHAIAASTYGGVLGVPAAFASSVFGELGSLGGDQGARDVIRRDPARVQAIAFARGAVDVDEPHDIERLAESRPIT